MADVTDDPGWLDRLAEGNRRALETKGQPVTARDPRWNWVEVTRLGQDPAHPSYVKGTCRHVELEPVSGVGTVAAPVYRCGTCGGYLRTVSSAELGLPS